jgi:hypothetical protein
MRYCKLLLMGGIVLALSMPAGAVSITMDIRNYDEGTLYNVSDGTYSQSQLDNLPTTPTVTGWQQRPVGGGGSDTWGIFRVGYIDTVPVSDPQLFTNGPSAHITAIFWGLQDTSMTQTTNITTGVVTQDIQGVGLHAAFFYDTTPAGEWAAAALTGPSGWVWDGVNNRPTYAGITDGTLIWTMNSTSGVDQSVPAAEFVATFNSGAATFWSHGNMNLDIGSNEWGTGSQNWTLDTNAMPGYDLSGNLGKFADLTLSFDGTDQGSGPWLLATSDPLDGNMIPEPVTMASLLLGFGCLSRYIRKRR